MDRKLRITRRIRFDENSRVGGAAVDEMGIDKDHTA
jgi:hypothetical protein